MVHLAKKLRSGRALLSAGALVASVLAAGVVPAGAVTDRADHAIRLSACVGDAATDRMFSDVSAGHVFRAAINCVAYYGITRGTGDGITYSPEEDVTRAEMAVFIARAAEVAGVELSSIGAASFNDIGDTWGEAQDAINRLAAAGVIPSGGAFRPDDAITRAEMATFLVGLLVEAAPDVTVDSTGAILLGVAGSRSVADDRFADTSDAKIAALYELGVTKGASPAEVQDPTMPSLDLNYEPEGTVDRGQMAAFITRALAHTGLRPRGVSAQFDGADVVVSVRDDNLKPVAGAPVDVFWAPTADAGSVFAADGTCDQATQADSSSGLCVIDETDPATASDGDARVAVTGLRRVPEGGAVVWAWTGELDETVGRSTDLHRLEVAEGADVGFASATLVTRSFDARKVRFGGSVLYSLQLRDIVGSVATGVNGRDPARWTLSVQVQGQDPAVQTLVSDSTGEAAFSISLAARPSGLTDDVTVTYTLSPGDNTPSASVFADGTGAATGTLTFSDEVASVAAGSATVTIDARDYVHVLGGAASNAATVTVLDQYGNPFPGAKVKVASALSGSGTVTLDTAEFTVDGRGSHRFAYQYSGTGAETETLTASYGAASAGITGPAATVYWAADAGPSDTGGPVLAGDVSRRHIVVDDSANGVTPVLLAYDDNDRFNLRGSPTSMAVFEAVLAEALNRASPGLSLSWSNYLPGSDRRVTEYSLT